jgi:hypothetical protein
VRVHPRECERSVDSGAHRPAIAISRRTARCMWQGERFTDGAERLRVTFEGACRTAI